MQFPLTLLSLAGAVALLLWGVHMVQTGVQRAFGARLRGALARRIDLKFAPDLRFRIDKSFAEGQRIDALLRRPEVVRDLEGEEPAPPAGDHTP